MKVNKIVIMMKLYLCFQNKDIVMKWRSRNVKMNIKIKLKLISMIGKTNLNDLLITLN